MFSSPQNFYDMISYCLLIYPMSEIDDFRAFFSHLFRFSAECLSSELAATLNVNSLLEARDWSHIASFRWALKTYTPASVGVSAWTEFLHVVSHLIKQLTVYTMTRVTRHFTVKAVVKHRPDVDPIAFNSRDSDGRPMAWNLAAVNQTDHLTSSTQLIYSWSILVSTVTNLPVVFS